MKGINREDADTYCEGELRQVGCVVLRVHFWILGIIAQEACADA
jgi:hypothetical protein